MSAITHSPNSAIRNRGARKRILALLVALMATVGIGLAAHAKVASAAVIPCWASNPTVLDAATMKPFSVASHIPGSLASTAWMQCPFGNVTVRVEWLRNGVLVNAGVPGAGSLGYASASAVTACYRGATYQPISLVKASAPGVIPDSKTIYGPYGKFCG